MPAAAVIPAPIAYIKVVAVKKLVVGFLLRSAGVNFVHNLVWSRHPPGERSGLSWPGEIQDFYFEEIRVFTAGKRLEYISME